MLPKLSIELVPSTQWGSNLRSALRVSKWDKLRRDCYEKAGHICEICGGSGLEQRRRHAVECHERWEYDDETNTQRLIGVIALCPFCHQVKHIGRALRVGAGRQALQWLANINEWTQQEVEAYIAFAFAIQQVRSVASWTLDLSWLFSKESPFDADEEIFRA